MKIARNFGAITALSALLLLTGCLATTPPPKPAMYQKLNRPYQSVNQAEALALINSYRQSKGKQPLTLNAKLTEAARIQAQAMAEAEKVSHALRPDLTLPKRLKRAGYDPLRAAENISAGYWTLAEAFSGWRDSKPHNANMLKDGITQMGIATHYRAGAKYQVFWALVLAQPDQTQPLPQPSGLPANHPVKLLTGG